MPPEFLFARHGQSVVNLTHVISNRVTDPTPLTELGRGQTQGLLTAIEDRPVIAVYSSPLTHAPETTQILADGFGLQIAANGALREPFCGMAEGRGDKEAWKLHAEQERAWRRRPGLDW